MLMKAWPPIQMPMPCTIRPAKTRSSAIAWRPMTKMRRVSQKKATMTAAHADEAQFLADHREQEVGVRLGQVVQLLDAAAQALAEDLAAAEGDQRMRQLVGLALRVRRVPRVEVGEDALARATG